MLTPHKNVNPTNEADARRTLRTLGKMADDFTAFTTAATEAMTRPRFFLGSEFTGTDLYTMERPNVALMLGWGYDNVTGLWNASRRADVAAYTGDLGGEVCLDFESGVADGAPVVAAEARLTPYRASWFQPYVPNEPNLGYYKTTNLPLYAATLARLNATAMPDGVGLALDCYQYPGDDFDRWWLNASERLIAWRAKMGMSSVTAFVSHRNRGDGDLIDLADFGAMLTALWGSGVGITFWHNVEMLDDTMSPYWEAYLAAARGAFI